MREIKFRGKQVDNDEWVYGWFSEDYGFAEILTEYNDWEVILETVGQYTGLKDRNGVEIYEGDIVTFLGVRWDGPDGDRVDYVGTVGYSDEYTAFNFEISNGMQAMTFGTDDIKVIGNIHDNPELMGEKEVT